jgi:hypothetical protein
MNNIEIQESSIDSDNSIPSSLNKLLNYFNSDGHMQYEVNKQMGVNFKDYFTTFIGHCGRKLDVKYKDSGKTVIEEKQTW